MFTRRHVRPVVFMDAELPFVTEQQAPGVTKYRSEIKAALGNLPIHSVLHEQLIHQMNETSNSFHVLILKTTLTVPYTSVFLRLDCKYWSDAAEQAAAPGDETSGICLIRSRRSIAVAGSYRCWNSTTRGNSSSLGQRDMAEGGAMSGKSKLPRRDFLKQAAGVIGAATQSGHWTEARCRRRRPQLGTSAKIIRSVRPKFPIRACSRAANSR